MVYLVGYTGPYNILDYSCISFPTKSTADKDIDTYPSDYQPLSGTCKAIHDECKSLQISFPSLLMPWHMLMTLPDDPAVVHGMPVSLQLVARRLEEEKVIAMTKKVLSVL